MPQTGIQHHGMAPSPFDVGVAKVTMGSDHCYLRRTVGTILIIEVPKYVASVPVHRCLYAIKLPEPC